MPEGRDREIEHPAPPFAPESASDSLSMSLASGVPGAAPLEPLEALPPELAPLAPLPDPELALALPPELFELASVLEPAPELPLVLEPVLELLEPLDPDVAPLEPLEPDVAPLEPFDPDRVPLEPPLDEPEPASQHAAKVTEPPALPLLPPLIMQTPPPSHGWPSSWGGHDAPKVPELPPPAPASTGAPHVCTEYDVELVPPLPPLPLLLLSNPALQTPPSPQALPTSAGRQYTPLTTVQMPQATVDVGPPGGELEHVACTHVAPPPQGWPTSVRAHGESAAAGWATATPVAQSSSASARGLPSGRGLKCTLPPGIAIP
jgi:hypothetical protein